MSKILTSNLLYLSTRQRTIAWEQGFQSSIREHEGATHFQLAMDCQAKLVLNKKCTVVYIFFFLQIGGQDQVKHIQPTTQKLYGFSSGLFQTN